MANIEFPLASGRRVGIAAHGEPDGDRLVVFCHPGPGSSVFDPEPRSTGYRGVHVIGLDRPGYGSSDPWPAGSWPSVSGYAADVAEYLRTAGNVARDLGSREFDSVGVVGWSAGGRIALALAAAHPTLIDRVVIVGTPAPDGEVPWMDPGLRSAVRELAERGPGAAVDGLAQLLQERMGVSIPRPGSDADGIGLLGLGPADEDALQRPGVRERLSEMVRDAFRQGTGGLAADTLAFSVRDWGFDPAQIRARTLILTGAEDPVLSADHARWYGERIPGSTVEVVPEVGQLAIVTAWERVLAFLAGAD